MLSSSTILPDAASDGGHKYKMLKRKLREMIQINESISQEYSRAQRKVRLLTLERSILLENIARIQNHHHHHHPHPHHHHRRQGRAHLRPASPTLSDDDLELSATDDDDNDDDADDNDEHDLTTGRRRQPIAAGRRHHGARGRSLRQPSTGGSGGDQQQRNTERMTTVSSAPPKRSRMIRSGTAKTRRVQPVERDEQGNVKLPQQIGVLTVVSLGKIVHDRDTFHNERYIFPVGFTVQRTYPSMVDPKSNTVVVSTILDGGDGPLFHVVAHDMPDQPIIANSATGAWTVVVRRSNEIRHREHSNSASGPDYYGFKHPTIAKLIQDLPGSDRLKHYVRQHFEEMEPRAARGVMAAAESKRKNLEEHGSANMRAARPLPPSPASTSSNTATAPCISNLLFHDDDNDDNDPSAAAADAAYPM